MTAAADETAFKVIKRVGEKTDNKQYRIYMYVG